jgi:hypothetical protein
MVGGELLRYSERRWLTRLFYNTKIKKMNLHEFKKYQKSINNLVSDGFTKDEATEIIDRQYSLLFIKDISSFRDIVLDVMATDGGLENN